MLVLFPILCSRISLLRKFFYLQVKDLCELQKIYYEFLAWEPIAIEGRDMQSLEMQIRKQ